MRDESFTYTEEVTGQIVQIPIGMLHHHPLNVRKDLGDLTELTESIRAKGILQNLTVVPSTVPEGATRWRYGYLVVIGNRRMEAAKLAGLETLPCVIAKMTEAEQVQTMLLENMQRNDLTIFEQAKGFQCALTYGLTLDDLAEKTGFSKTTIKRRLKIADLDNSTLRAVCCQRQLSLGDFDRLAEIVDLDVRNEVLKSIGTANFEIELRRAIRKQKIAARLPSLMEQLEKLGAKRIEQKDMYSSKYDYTGCRVEVEDWNGEPFRVKGDKLFYFLNENNGVLEFYRPREKEKPVRRSAEEVYKEQQAREAAGKLREASAMHCKLRTDFIRSVKVTAKNRQIILIYAVKAILYDSCNRVSSGSPERIAEACGIDLSRKRYDSSRWEKLAEVMEKDKDLIPRMITAFLGENSADPPNYYYASERDLKEGLFPMHTKNEQLDMIYDYLCALGYELSDEEKALREGRSEWFREVEEEEEEEDEE